MRRTLTILTACILVFLLLPTGQGHSTSATYTCHRVQSPDGCPGLMDAGEELVFENDDIPLAFPPLADMCVRIMDGAGTTLFEETVPLHEISSTWVAPGPGNERYEWSIGPGGCDISLFPPEKGGVIDVLLAPVTICWHTPAIGADGCPTDSTVTYYEWDGGSGTDFQFYNDDDQWARVVIGGYNFAECLPPGGSSSLVPSWLNGPGTYDFAWATMDEVCANHLSTTKTTNIIVV